MKRTIAAGIFALLAGGATLLLVASIFYSCRGGGRPHDMGNDTTGGSSSHSSSAVPTAPQLVVNDRPSSLPAHRINLGSSSPAAL